jgi:DNA-binding NtrC family response regulator
MTESASIALNQTHQDSFLRPTVLIVDDDADWRSLASQVCTATLNDLDILVLDCATVSQAIELLSTRLIHALVLDKDLGPDSNDPRQNGIASVPHLSTIQDHMRIVMATGSSDIQDVVEAMRNGAAGYVVKDQDPRLFAEIVRREVVAGLQLLRAKLESEKQADSRNVDLMGKSHAVHLLRSRIHEMAKNEAAVLLLGETGTGKSTAARLLHDLSNQKPGVAKRPFVHINMAAIPEKLAEAELFGTDPHAFTGASHRIKLGAIEQANGGTLFLDEIGEASLSLQAKLLTVLDTGEFKRVGGEKYVRSRFRLICATNRNLEQMVKEKKFRADLLRRISIIEIRVPSLAERKEDIDDIIRAVLPKCCKQAGVYVDFEEIPKDFRKHLTENPPAGNIGGVEQQLCRLLLYTPRDKRGRPILKQWKHLDGLGSATLDSATLSPEIITAEDILSKPLDVVGRNGFSNLRQFLEEIERKVHEDARRKYGNARGSNKIIARALQVSEPVLSGRTRYFGFTRSRQSETQAQESAGIA